MAENVNQTETNPTRTSVVNDSISDATAKGTTKVSRKSSKKKNETIDTNEFVLFHYQSFSIITSRNRITEFQSVIFTILNRVFPLRRATVINYSLNPIDEINSEFIAVPLICDKLTYKEYVMVTPDESLTNVLSVIAEIRSWKIKATPIQSNTENAQLNSWKSTQLNIKINSFAQRDWTNHILANIELRERNMTKPKEAGRLLAPLYETVENIKMLFIQFSLLHYTKEIRKSIEKQSMTEDRLKLDIKDLSTRQKYALHVCDSGMTQLMDSSTIGETNIANDGQIIVIHEIVGDVVLVPSNLSIDESVTKFLVKKTFLVKCLSDNQPTFVLSCADWSDFGNLRNTILPYFPNDCKLTLYRSDGSPAGNAEGIDYNKIVHYSVILPLPGITIKDKIGKGSFGFVYKCIDETNGKELAIKRINFKKYESSDKCLAIKNETVIPLKAGFCERIMAYNRFFEFDGNFYILMNLMKDSITSYVKKHPMLSEDIIISLSKQILEGLHHLHCHYIIHGNLKGVNVLLDNKLSVKLTDFGVSKCVPALSIKLTKTDEMGPVCSYDYLSPEAIAHFHGEENVTYGTKSDIWSFGGIMIEMITGKMPDIISDLMGKERPRYKLRSGLNKKLKFVLDSCLYCDYDDRPTCEELLMYPIFKSNKSNT